MRIRPVIAGVAAGAVLAVGAALVPIGSEQAAAAGWTKAERIRVPRAGAPTESGPVGVDVAMRTNGAGVVGFGSERGKLWVARNTGVGRRFAPARKVFPKVTLNSMEWSLDATDRGLLALVYGVQKDTNLEVGLLPSRDKPLFRLNGALQAAPGRYRGPQRLRRQGEAFAPGALAVSGRGKLVTAFTGNRGGAQSTYARQGSVGAGRFFTTATLSRGVATREQPEGLSPEFLPVVPSPQAGISAGGRSVVVWTRFDGAIATAVKGRSGPWQTLPPLDPIANGPEAMFALDVAPNGRAALAVARDGSITVHDLPRGAEAWGAPEVVASEQESTQTPGGDDESTRIVGVDVATAAGGAVAVAWGVQPEFAGAIYGTAVKKPGGAWPAPSLQRDPVFDSSVHSWGLARVDVEMDGQNNAVAIFTSFGATQGTKNPIYASVSSAAGSWSRIQDLARFCDTSEDVVGPSLDGGARRGVLVAWGCADQSPKVEFGAPGVVLTRTFR